MTDLAKGLARLPHHTDFQLVVNSQRNPSATFTVTQLTKAYTYRSGASTSCFGHSFFHVLMMSKIDGDSTASLFNLGLFRSEHDLPVPRQNAVQFEQKTQTDKHINSKKEDISQFNLGLFRSKHNQ